MKIVYLLILSFFLTACSAYPEVKQLPIQTVTHRLFKIEQFDEQRKLQQNSLLSLQTAQNSWRWVQTDPLGAPLARVILTPQGWENDGFVMPNRQAQWLYTAISTELSPKQTIFAVKIASIEGKTTCYQTGNKLSWCRTLTPTGFDIKLADNSLWHIEELNN